MAPFHPKVMAGALAAYVTTVVIAEAGRRGYTITGDEGAAITGILGIVAGWFMPADPTGGSP